MSVVSLARVFVIALDPQAVKGESVKGEPSVKREVGGAKDEPDASKFCADLMYMGT